MEKKTKKAKTVKTAKTTKSTKSTKATKTKKVKKATKTTKSTKSTKATKIAKKELTAKDRKKVTGGLKPGSSFGIRVRGDRALSCEDNPLCVLDSMNKMMNGKIVTFDIKPYEIHDEDN